MTTGRLRSALQAAALVVGSLLVLVVVLELALRVLWSGYYPKFDPKRPLGEFDFHPERGLTPAPNVEKYDWTEEYHIWQRHNSLGFRGPEITLEKPPGRTRILMIGDSQTYGTGVENDETFSAVLEQLDPNLQVINAGVGGYETARELLMLREWVPKLHPDIVLVAYFWNDVFEVRDGRYAKAELRDGKVHFIPPNPASLENPYFDGVLEKHVERMKRYGWLRLESRLYRFLSDRFKVLHYAIRDWMGKGKSDYTFPFQISPEDEKRVWKLTFALLEEMQKLSTDQGARFGLIVVPDQVQVEPDVVVYGVPDVLYRIQEEIRGFGEREGVPVIDPEAQLHEIRAEQGVPLYFRIDRHLNPAGHRALAGLLLESLRKLGWVSD